jgi:hypothetical protein
MYSSTSSVTDESSISTHLINRPTSVAGRPQTMQYQYFLSEKLPISIVRQYYLTTPPSCRFFKFPSLPLLFLITLSSFPSIRY